MIENTTKTATIFDALPGMIEASEARGQAQLVASTLLPTDMGGKRAMFERMGFKFGEIVKDDPLFINAELPTGWSKRGTDHSMHSVIVDENGCERVGIFYKAAFYDRKADMHLTGRYKVDAPWGDDNYQTVKTATAKVIDQKTGAVLHEATGKRTDMGNGYVEPACSVAQTAAFAWCKDNTPEDWIEAWFVE
jgi:hypothetical protein